MQFAKLFVLLLYNSGITHCVGIPGVQNSLFFSYLQECGIKIILVSNEKEAIAVALGINSIPQNKALLGLIGGPGITHSLTDLFFSKLNGSAESQYLGPFSCNRLVDNLLFKACQG